MASRRRHASTTNINEKNDEDIAGVPEASITLPSGHKPSFKSHPAVVKVLILQAFS
jgi:hypothetical protein